MNQGKLILWVLGKWKLLAVGFCILITTVHYNIIHILQDGVYFQIKMLSHGGNAADQRLKELEMKSELDFLSKAIRKEIRDIQSAENCTSYNMTLQCGMPGTCGLGCQVHHRMICLMNSYVLKVLLISGKESPYYNTPWESIFQAIGSKCARGQHWFQFKWDPYAYPNISIQETCTDCPNNTDIIEYPLKEGIPVPDLYFDRIMGLHKNPFEWLLSQFLQVRFQLNSKMQIKLDRTKEELKWISPVVGCHVRRTDKYTEAYGSVHELVEYIREADIFIFNNCPPPDGIKRIFVASDTPEVIRFAKKEYKLPEYQIMGFELNPRKKREDTLEETALDLFLLAETEFVVCGYSSNLCRLVQEMLFIKHDDAFERVKSLDGSYRYIIIGKELSRKIVKASNSNHKEFFTGINMEV